MADEEVGLGFDLDAGPVVATIDQLGAASERAAASADKLAAAGRNVATSVTVAKGQMDALASEVTRIIALFNALDTSTGTNQLAAREAEAVHAVAEETARLTANQQAVAAATARAAEATRNAATADAEAAAERRALNAELAKAPPVSPIPPPVAANVATTGGSLIGPAHIAELTTVRAEMERVAVAATAMGASEVAAAEQAHALSAAHQELIARAEQWVARAHAVDAANAEAVASFTAEAVAIRDAASAMRAMNLVEESLQRGGAIVDANAASLAKLAAETEAYAIAAQLEATATKAATVETAALGTAAAASGGGVGVLSRGLSAITGVVTGAGAGIGGLVGSLATMAIGSVVISGVLAGVAAITKLYQEYTRGAREAKEAADAFRQSDAGFAARARAQAQERAVSGDRAFRGGLFTLTIEAVGATKQITDAMKAVEGLRAQLAKPFSINLDFGNNLNPFRLREFNTQVAEMQRQFAAGNLTAGQFEHGLTALERAFPDFARQILQVREIGSAFDEAAKASRRLQAQEANRVAEGRATIAANGVPGISFEQGGDAAVRLAEQRKAAAEAQDDARAAAAGGELAVQALHDQRDAMRDATAGWRDYAIATGNATVADLSFSEAINRHIPAAMELLRTTQTQIAASQQATRTIALQAEVTRGTGELEKVRALNGAYRESEVAQRILGITLDAANQKRQDALSHTPAELTRLNALTDATAKARIQQVLLNDQLDREARLRQSRTANAAALETATNARNRAGLAGPDAEVQAVRDRAEEEIHAEQRRFEALRGLTAAQRRDEQTMLQERIANIRAVEVADEARVRAARQAAFDLGVRTSVRDTTAETEGLRAMIAAELQGARAAEAMRVQLAGQDAVTQALNDATARGATLTAEQAAQLRGAAEEYERTRIAAEKFRAVQSEVRAATEQFFTDLFNHKNPFIGLGERIKAEIVRAISAPIEAKITAVITDVLGIEQPASQQQQAAAAMNEAADKQLRAAELMNGSVSGDGLVESSPSTVPKDGSVSLERFKRAFEIAGSAYGGYQVGYGIGQSTQSAAGGAIAGAYSGAAMGAAVAGPWGAVAGGVAGLVGGLLGARDAARAMAEELKQAQHAAADAATAFHEQATGSTDVEAALKKAAEDFAAVAAKIAAAYPGSKPPYGSTEVEYKPPTADALWRQAIDDYRKLKERIERDYAQSVTNRYEDFHANYLDATGQHRAAEAERTHNETLRGRRELVDSFGEQIDAAEQRALDEYDRWRAALEKGGAALNGFTTSVNSVSGFKLADLNPYLQEFAQGRPYPGTTPINPLPVPVNPFVPPQTPLAPPQLSRTGTVATQPITIAPGAIVIQESKTPELTAIAVTRMVLTEIDKERNAGRGLASPRSAALDKMKLPPGGTPWRS